MCVAARFVMICLLPEQSTPTEQVQLFLQSETQLAVPEMIPSEKHQNDVGCVAFGTSAWSMPRL